MSAPSSTHQTLDRLDQTLQGIGGADSRALAINLDRIRTAMAVAPGEGSTIGGVGSRDLESRFRTARREVALQRHISDLISHVNMFVNDPTVGSDARAARDLLRKLPVA